MNFKQILPYKLRRALTIGAIAGGTLTACDNHTNEPIIPTRDIELEFDRYQRDNIEPENIRKYVNMPDVRYIYMVSLNDGWNTATIKGIHNLRDYLQERINIDSLKIRGKGSFDFALGELSKDSTRADSLWFVQKGWTIKSR